MTTSQSSNTQPARSGRWKKFLLMTLAIAALAGLAWQTSRLLSPPRASVPQAETWDQAVRDHQQFVRNSSGLSREDLVVEWQGQAKTLSAALAIAPEPAAQDIRHRLLGLYGSLGDWQSARQLNELMLTKAEGDKKAKLQYNLACLDDILSREAGADDGAQRRFETSAATAAEALDASATPALKESAIHLAMMRAERLAKRGAYADAAVQYHKAERIMASVAATDRSSSPIWEPGYVAITATTRFLPQEATPQWREFATALRDARSAKNTYSSALTLKHKRRALTDVEFKPLAEEALTKYPDPDAWELRYALATVYRLAGDPRTAATHLFELTKTDLTKSSTDPAVASRRSLMPMVYDDLAGCLAQLGEKNQAIEWYTRVATDFPDSQQAKYAHDAIARYTR
ncbi:MAG: hypothetical protein H0V44_01375 [Planctomycetes bacterium]|nr:hypothetical protein [Planctomycetota bacterium]